MTAEEITKPVRVRFAPSPTGAPHIGNLRTALFNWLLARHTNGKFILRVEDTDQAREVDNGLDLILESLRFLGLDWDEGPDIGGTFGPYRQSERLHLYAHYGQELIDKGAAYYCYCTPERLEQMRKEQQARGEPTRYDRRCRWYTPAERAQHEAAGEPRTIRLAVPLDGSTTLHDFIHGDITIDNRDVDDQVLIKSDCFPTYHMAVVVDDHLMEITHVMRGDDWIPSFPKHILLYQAFGWEPPLHGHLPNVLGPDKKKLSKRHGSTSILSFRDEGYLPEALFNFLALLGWSYDDHTELFSREQLIELFSLDHVHRAPAIFDRTKLDWMNGHYIRSLATDDLAERLLPFLTRAGIAADLETTKKIAPLVQERIKRLDEIVDKARPIFEVPAAPVIRIFGSNEQDKIGLTRADSIIVLKRIRQDLGGLDSFEDGEKLDLLLRKLSDELGLKPATVFGALRFAVSGSTVSLPMIGMLKILGKEESMRRVDTAITWLEKVDVETAA